MIFSLGLLGRARCLARDRDKKTVREKSAFSLEGRAMGTKYGSAIHRAGLAIAAATLLLAATPVGAMAADQLTIGYVTKSATNQGWILINRGAADAAKDAGVQLI